MSFSDETRRAERKVIKLPVTIRINPSMEKDFLLSRRELSACTIDISPSGISMISSVYIPEGVLLDIEINAESICPDAPAGRNEVRFNGEVVSVHMQGGQYRLGVLIKEIDPDSKSIISKLINAV